MDTSLTQGRARVFTSEKTKLKHVVRELVDHYFMPEADQEIVRAVCHRSNYLIDVKATTEEKYIVSIPSKFRKKIWIQRGQYLIVEPIAEGKKVKAEVVHVLFPEHVQHLQENCLWPKVFEPPFKGQYQKRIAAVDRHEEAKRKAEADEAAASKQAGQEMEASALADTAAGGGCNASSPSESEEEQDDSDLFVNRNRLYMYGEPTEEEVETSEEDDDEEEEEEEGSDADDEEEEEVDVMGGECGEAEDDANREDTRCEEPNKAAANCFDLDVEKS
ncbi:probable RNA-binding protein EIF1AD [Sycon ciliatum]|uniref:probable RNA-binding protein EIF1AD n=1 Tax=Sycon ciliatum TaxID=27933 RepID=UPI0031F63931